jgi:hypothetical protein
LKIKIDQETEFNVLLMKGCINQLSRSEYQRIELIPLFEVYANRGKYNVTYNPAHCGIYANFSVCLKDAMKGPFRLELLLTNLFLGILGGKPFVLAFLYALL